jgi:hypothetical protein
VVVVVVVVVVVAAGKKKVVEDVPSSSLEVAECAAVQGAAGYDVWVVAVGETLLSSEAKELDVLAECCEALVAAEVVWDAEQLSAGVPEWESLRSDQSRRLFSSWVPLSAEDEKVTPLRNCPRPLRRT